MNILLQGESGCQLFSDESLSVVVAIGRVFNDGGTILHGKPLPANTLRVSIDVSLKDTTPLPFLIEDLKVVFDAVGGFVAWPKTWMSPLSQVVT